jgi:hypothetical protein
MADEKKVFDVAKPGSTKPDTGSKPMVVGHKIMKDPTLTNDEESTDATDMPIAQQSKIKISPVSEEFASEKSDDTVSTSTDQSEHVNTIAEDESGHDGTASETLPESQSPPQQTAEATAEEKKEAILDNRIEQEENLQKIIKEKTYVVPIEEASYSAFKTFVKTFAIVSILGVIVLVVLIDAEIIDLGISLPFDLL